MPTDNEQPGQVTAPVTVPVTNVLTEESAVALLDNNQLTPEVKVAEPITSAANPPVTTIPSPAAIDKPASETKVEPVVEKPVDTTAPPPAPVYEVEIGDTKINVDPKVYEYISAMHQAQEDYEAQLTALEEFKKNPYEFHAKYNPAIVIDHFKPEVYVQQKLTEKFGEHVFDPNKAYTIGTTDYMYRKAMETFEKEAENYIATAETATKEQAAKGNTVYNEVKTKVMAKYNLTEEAYKSQVQDWLDAHSQEDVLSLIVGTRLAANNGNAYKEKIAEEVKRTNEVVPPSALINGNAAPVIDDNTKKMAGVFGEIVYTANQS